MAQKEFEGEEYKFPDEEDKTVSEDVFAECVQHPG